MKPITKKIIIVGIILVFAASALLYGQMSKADNPLVVLKDRDNNTLTPKYYPMNADGLQSLDVGGLLCGTAPSLKTPFCCDVTAVTKIVLTTNMSRTRYLELHKTWANGTFLVQGMNVTAKDGSITAEVQCDEEYEIQEPATNYWIRFTAKGRAMRGQILNDRIEINSDPDCVTCFRLLDEREQSQNT